MAGLIKSNVQLGDSATATQNFTLTVPATPDGTVKLARGNAGATTQDILTVDASGVVRANQGINLNSQIVETGGAGVGYGTGSGGTVTQATSRTTGVTINKPTGKITLFTAAGSSTWASFRVTNSTVAATDTVVVCASSGMLNYYVFTVGAVSAGYFDINFASLLGTVSDTPVINFAIIKGATA